MIYLALGDSMSIDAYTGVEGGGAVSQFHQHLGAGWTLEDHTRDGCCIAGVPTDRVGQIVTLTVGGNDLLGEERRHIADGFAGFQQEHLELLRSVRSANPEALFLVGNIYAPQFRLSATQAAGLERANEIVAANCRSVGACLVDIRAAFRGHEADYLCLDIEPSHAGATVIAGRFRALHSAHQALLAPAVAAALRALRYDPEAAPAYEGLSGGLVWSDEWSDELSQAVGTLTGDRRWLFRYVSAYRASLIRGTPDWRLSHPWEALQATHPDWPGFHPARRSGDLRGVLERDREEFVKELDDALGERSGDLE